MPNKYGLSRSISSQVRKAVRTKCGFGCVVCGVPIYDYAHIIPFKDVEEHDESNIVLLCKNHHGQESTGLAKIEDYRSFINSPYNLRRGNEGILELFLSKRERVITFGGCVATLDMNSQDEYFELLSVSDVPLIHFKVVDGELHFSFDITNVFGQRFVQVNDNVLSFSAPSIADLKWSAGLLDAKSTGGFRLKVDLSSNNRIVFRELYIPLPGGSLSFHERTGILTAYKFRAQINDCMSKSSSFIYRGGALHVSGLYAFGGHSDRVPVSTRFPDPSLLGMAGGNVIISNSRM